MREVSDLICTAQPPDDAQYCHICGQPLECQHCHSRLLHPARLCSKCGEEITFRPLGRNVSVGVENIPLGYTFLKTYRTPFVSEKCLIIPPGSPVEHNGEIIHRFLDDEIRSEDKALSQNGFADVVEEVQAARPQQLPPTSSSAQEIPEPPTQTIWTVFHKHEGKIAQERIKLGAKDTKCLSE